MFHVKHYITHIVNKYYLFENIGKFILDYFISIKTVCFRLLLLIQVII